jgi:hypothetical protein
MMKTTARHVDEDFTISGFRQPFSGLAVSLSYVLGSGYR